MCEFMYVCIRVYEVCTGYIRMYVGHAVGQLVQALLYKPEGRGFIGSFH